MRAYGVTSVSDKFLVGHRKRLSRVAAEDYIVSILVFS